MTATDEVLRDASRCVLAVSGEDGPLLAPMAFWSDGAALWMATAPATALVGPLPRRQRCEVYVPPPADGDVGVIVAGEARVHGFDDPVGLLLHSLPLSAAMGALALRNLPALGASARKPSRWLPRNRVALRVGIDARRVVPLPEAGHGVAPALPDVVPADVRRAVSGCRQVVLATGTGDDLRVRPAIWGAGFELDLAPGADLGAGTPATVAVDADLHESPANARGLAVSGRLSSDLKLVPERATWWHGFDVEVAAVPARPAGGVVLPE